jgi:hypothetical protein
MIAECISLTDDDSMRVSSAFLLEVPVAVRTQPGRTKVTIKISASNLADSLRAILHLASSSARHDRRPQDHGSAIHALKLQKPNASLFDHRP